MHKKIHISDSELPIMKSLWRKGPCTSPELFEGMDKNASTLKTLLGRLVDKGAVEARPISSRTYCYAAILTQEEYIRNARKSFLHTVFDDSREKLLLNFITEEHVTREDLERLMQLIDEEEEP